MSSCYSSHINILALLNTAEVHTVGYVTVTALDPLFLTKPLLK